METTMNKLKSLFLKWKSAISEHAVKRIELKRFKAATIEVAYTKRAMSKQFQGVYPSRSKTYFP